MAINYEDNIHIIEDDKDNYYLNRIKVLPDQCPICNHGISPTYLLIYKKNGHNFELLCGCPKNDCGSLFFAGYSGDIFSYSSFYSNMNYLYPKTKVQKEFNLDIKKTSPTFVEIYNQAYQAEQDNLTLICGGAYRKSLEFLLKDYIIRLHPDEEEKVKNTYSIQRCIDEYIEHDKLKAMAERATWLGNDETHYIKKWEDKDINDLKNLIEVTIYFITMNLRVEIYNEQMKK